MSAVLWLLVLLPGAVGALLVVSGVAGSGRTDRLAAPAATTTATATLALAVVAAAVRPSLAVTFLPVLPARAAVDGLSAAMVVTVGAVTLLVLAYAAAELRAEPGSAAEQSRGRFFGLLLVFSAAMQLTVVASSLPVLLVGWEVMGATSYALIGFWWRDPHRGASALTAFLTTRAADLGLYLAAGAAVAGAASADRGVLASLPGLPAGWRDVAAAGIVVAAAGKSAQLPFSFWLSRAMDGPSPVSALLHSATMVAAGAYLVLRTAPLLHATDWAASTVAWLGAATAIVLSAAALAQRDLKQLLAASTCAQVGFMFLAAGSGAVAGGALQLVAHAATKALLFGVAGVWLSALGTRQLPALVGAARRWRPAGIAFTVGALGLAGVPPLALWTAKDAALAGAATSDLPLYVAGLAGAGLSAAYSARALAIVWQPVPAGVDAGYDTEQPGTRRVTAAMLAPLFVLAVAAVGLVTLGLPPLAAAVRRGLDPTAGAAAGVDSGGAAAASAADLTVSAVLAVVVAVATVVTVRRGWRVPVPAAVVGAAQGWWGLEWAARVLIVRPTLRLAGAAGGFDRRLDRAVEAVAGATVGLAGWTRRRGETGVDGAVAAVAAGARGLGRLARRPQTGQLHQYYAQALVAVAAVVVVLLIVR